MAVPEGPHRGPDVHRREQSFPIQRPRTLSIVVAVCFVLVFAAPVHVFPCGTQASHYALVRSLATGTARIDEYEWFTCDKALYQGHYYSVKAPGLAVLSLPAYLLLDRTGLRPDDMRWAVWLLSLVTLVPAALLLVYLVGRTAESIAPGWGRFTAIALGAGTLVLPFGSLWFAHVPAAVLAFAAFVVVRDAGKRLSSARALAAGLLAGATVLFEYPVALIAAALLVYVAVCHGPRAGLRFVAGSALPAACLLLYNQWAFGSFAHFSYRYALPLTTTSTGEVVGVNDVGFFGITWPSADALAEVLFSPRGLLTLSPICLVGAVGVVLLYRRARRQALLLGALVAMFLAYNAGYTLNAAGPFGGDTPGPRFLIVILPVLLVSAGLAARASPGAAAALLVASVSSMALVTATTPMLGGGEEERWMRELRAGTFVKTFASGSETSGWIAILPFAVPLFILLAVGVADAVRAARARPASAAFGAATAAIAWLLVLEASHFAYRDDNLPAALVAYAIAAVLAAATVVAAREAGLRGPPGRLDSGRL